jgi:heat shock protein HslJ
MYILSKIITDWVGTYTGALPCADCEGISTTLILNKDLTYKLLTIYLGKGDKTFESNGNFIWNNEGTIIILLDESNEWKQQYEVVESKLFHLDEEGNRITSNLAYMYILSKSGSEITEKYWKLVELMGKEVVRDERMQKDPHIIFRTQDNRVNGYAGCNSFSGSYEVQGGYRLRISSVAMTQMACLDMTIETEFVRVLNTADSYLVKGDTLFLYRARMAPLARFEALYLD